MESRPPASVIHGMDAIASPRVLVVDDEPQVVWVLRFGLESEGYDVATARNGVEALEQVSIHRPELMVLDVMMPKMDGWTVLRELAKLPPAERPRVVMVTALASVDDKAKATALGADAYVPKPFDVDELVQVLHGLQKAS